MTWVAHKQLTRKLNRSKGFKPRKVLFILSGRMMLLGYVGIHVAIYWIYLSVTHETAGNIKRKSHIRPDGVIEPTFTNHRNTQESELFAASLDGKSGLEVDPFDETEYDVDSTVSIKISQVNMKSKPERTAAMIIAVVPYSEDRLLALWSQLECFHQTGKFQEIIISAPHWAREDKILEPFVREAIASIPHFQEVGSPTVTIQYYLNDRYDVGLWCDSLKSKHININSQKIHESQLTSPAEQYDDFVLVNDSLMAVERDFSGILDVLREKKLAMTSLNYSRSDYWFWLESAMRGFSSYGIERFMEHACIPASHEIWCRELQSADQKRCIVEHFEIKMVEEFAEEEVWGLFSSDVPENMITEERVNNGKTW
mmetsp:Transcript_12204/g.17773  ORF Transcript_12204/g.17773 Transcript_12204/m.17773 type:complete len:370 (-) Transcript_12204:496-1605(-)